MVFPLIPALAVGGFATSAAGNLYSQYRQRKLYAQLGKGYAALDRGYRSYLKTQGRTINPNRNVTKGYYGQYLRAQTNQDVSLARSIGTLGGTIGAGTMITSRWL